MDGAGYAYLRSAKAITCGLAIFPLAIWIIHSFGYQIAFVVVGVVTSCTEIPFPEKG